MLALASCPAPRTGDGSGPPRGGDDAAPTSHASAHEHRAGETTGDDPEPATTGDTEASPPAPSSFRLEPSRNEAWVVAAGACVRLSFRPHDASTGSLLVRGVRIDYVQRAGELELGPASRSEGDGVVSRPCRTRLRMGPGWTLGGATLFHDEATCSTGRATAAPLDDSAVATAARCRGEPVAVTTDEVVCGTDGRHSVVAGRPGCIGVALGWGP